MENENSRDLIQAFGKNLADYLERQGKTQRELAQKLDVSPSEVNGWVRQKGKHLPRIEKLVQISEFCNCSLDDLLSLKSDGTASKNPTQSYQSIAWIENASVATDYSKTIEDEIHNGISLFKRIVLKGEQGGKNHLQELDVTLRAGAIRLTHVERNEAQEQALHAMFPHLRDAIVVKLPESENGQVLKADYIKAEMVAFWGCRILDKLSESDNLADEPIALGQGYILRRISEQQPYSSQRFRGTKWIPIITENIRGQGFSHHTASYIAASMACRYPNSEVLYLPYLFPHSEANLNDANRNQFHENAISELENAKVLFTTINSLMVKDFSQKVEFNGLLQKPPKPIADLGRKIRELHLEYQVHVLHLNNILNADGDELKHPELDKFIRQKVYSIDEEIIRGIGHSHGTWLLAVGDHKARPVLGLLKSQLLNSLIIDSGLAEQILQLRIKNLFENQKSRHLGKGG